jgi:hypothetical protein
MEDATSGRSRITASEDNIANITIPSEIEMSKIYDKRKNGG